MKNHHIKDLVKKELLILELPRVCDYELDEEMIWVINLENGLTYRAEGSYTLLGKPDEIREEDAEDLVEIFDLSYYVNYNHPTRGAYTLTAKESLLSAIESVIFWENPLGKDKPNFDPFLNYGQNEYWVGLKNKWNEAELRTFDRNRALIFVKN